MHIIQQQRIFTNIKKIILTVITKTTVKNEMSIRHHVFYFLSEVL